MERDLVLLLLWVAVVAAVVPTAEIRVKRSGVTIYAAPGSFSAGLSGVESAFFHRLLIPDGDTEGCSPVAPSWTFEQFYFLVSRGNCSFGDKARAAESAGAKGVLVYNSLEGIYQGNDYASETDYECDNGYGYVDEIVYPVYGDEMTASIPSDCTQDSRCSSGKCVVTNITDANGTKVCCAWDLYITMGDEAESSIPAVFLRMEDAATLFSISELETNMLDVLLFERSTTAMDYASLALWVIAILVIVLGSYRAAEVDKQTCKYDFDKLGVSRSEQSTTRSRSSSQSEQALRGNLRSYGTETNHLRATRLSHQENETDDDLMDISTPQAIGFVALSSAFLVLLYYVNLYFAVTVLYLCAAAVASCWVLFLPMLITFRNKFCSADGQPEVGSFDETMHTTWPGILAAIFGCLLSLSWYAWRKSDIVWVAQDIMGACVCVLFLSSVRLPNLKVATILLSLAFIYDVFFVFISPYVFSSSVMLTVASGTSTTVTSSDENFCEKYPEDDQCNSSGLPMLFIMPTLFSYLDSEAMLGLGDVVLPGLLLVWAARYDVRRFGSLSLGSAEHGYFGMTLFAYSVGLLCANIAVAVFDYGQPALLYIVPFTLSSVLFRAHANRTLDILWLALPPMKIFAKPLNVEEQEALLGRPDVVVTEASWMADLTSHKSDVILLSPEHIRTSSPLTDSAQDSK